MEIIKKKNLNTRFIEIEKGLRYSINQEISQSENILKSVELMNQYPFPHIINTIYTRFAELFKTT